jgi:PAS domain S-box-containing protein
MVPTFLLANLAARAGDGNHLVIENAMNVTDKAKSRELSLRQRAEAITRHMLSAEANSDRFLFPAESKKVLQELRVLQIELEMQNEILRDAQEALEESRDRYVDLYDFAPVGYLTLTDKGMIEEINLTAATLLGVERKKLQNHLFASLIAANDRTRWMTQFLNVLEKGDKGEVEVAIKRHDGTVFQAQLDCQQTKVGDGETAVRIALTDIRERKQLETSLRKNAARSKSFSDALDNIASSCVYMKDLSRQYYYANKVTLKLFKCSAEELLGSGDEQFFPPDIVVRLKAVDDRVLENGESTMEEIDVSPDSPERRVYLEVKTPIFDDAGKITGLCGISTDITERKQMEEALRESELRFSLFMENLPACAYIKDAQGRHIFVNAALASQTMASGNSLLGKANGDLWPKEIAAKLDSADAAVITSRSPLILEEDVLMNNEVRTYRTTKFPIELSNGEALLGGISFDITERKQAEENLRRSENKFKMLFALSPVGMAMVDHATGEFLEVNNSILQAVGYTKDEFLKLSYWDITPREYEAQEMQQIRDLNEKGRFGPNEKEYIRKDGSRYPLRISGAVFTEVSDRPVVWGVIEDITKSKQAEAELIQHRDHLEELVAARTSELEQSRDAAEAGNRAKTIFLDNMSHELRTPMNGVMGMIDLALRRATDPKQTDMLNKSRGAAQRMIKLVNDIIDFSKLEAERLPLEEKNFSLSHMIDDVAAMHDIIAEEKGLTLIREIPATFPDQLSGDAFRLRQILLNFLGNACKFSEQGMITVRVSAVEQDDDSLLARIEVEDQGIGINPEQQAMLFQAFTQADGSMTRKYGGAGLGLIISKRLANLMGGDVGMVSHEGHGSTFWATVRLKQAKAREVGT